MAMSDREFSDTRGDRDIKSIGPFDLFPVMMNGWTVPKLEAQYTDDGVALVLDRRFRCTVPADMASEVIMMVADATAIALGWSCHPRSVDWVPPSGYWDASGPPFRSVPWLRLSGMGVFTEENT